MHTWITPLSRLEAYTQVADYTSALMKVLQNKGADKCTAKILKVKKKHTLRSIGQMYFDLLEADDLIRVKALEAGPYLKKDNPSLWNTPEFKECS